MKPKFLYSLLLLATIPQVAHSQMMMARRLLGGLGAFGYASVGTQTVDIKGLNARLNAFGYPSFDDTYVTFGGGGHVMVGKLMLGGEGTALLQPGDNVMGNFRTSLSGFYGGITLGYQLYSSGSFLIYPQLGLGGGGMILKIMERSSPTFDEVLNNPRRGAELSSMGFVMDLGLGARYLVLFREGARHGLSLGLRAGYTFSFSDRRWRLNRIEVPGGPSGSFTGYYVRLMLGGGGARMHGEEDDD